MSDNVLQVESKLQREINKRQVKKLTPGSSNTEARKRIKILTNKIRKTLTDQDYATTQ